MHERENNHLTYGYGKLSSYHNSICIMERAFKTSLKDNLSPFAEMVLQTWEEKMWTACYGDVYD